MAYDTRRGTCGLIDPAFENQNFWKDFNPHLETELLYLDDSVSLAGPSFTFEVKVGLLVLEHLTAKRPLNFVTYNVLWTLTPFSKIFFSSLYQTRQATGLLVSFTFTISLSHQPPAPQMSL